MSIDILMRRLTVFTLTLAIITGLLVTSCDSSGGGGGSGGSGNKTPGNKAPEIMSDGTALQYFQKEKINVGWNLGNTLDAVNSGMASETGWGNPLATQALFNGVKSLGYDIVRIPVTWSGHIGSAPDYKLSSTRLARVKTVVDYAHNAGLKVIINIHHDDSPDNNGWLKIGDAAASTAVKNQITERYGKLWTQVAEQFKSYGEWLIFESLNEVQDGGWGWSPAFRANPRAQMDILNEWNQLFTDNVRKTGGNNAKRFLMYPSYASNPEAILPDGLYEGGAGGVGAMFKLPTDGGNSGRQIVTFHYYDPFDFAHNGIRVDWESINGGRINANSLFARFKRSFVDKNIPVVIGEMGPVRSTGYLTRTETSNGVVYSDPMSSEQLSAAKANRITWINYVFGKAKEYGLVPIHWDNGVYSSTNAGDQFGYINRSNGQPNSDESRDLINAMMKAVGNK
jgi:endoglucanase